ncbi:MAG: alpha/beta fold hydrolase [Novosphingobium sp.]|nr:alpha/beta fold hydrolase [Novosphingobium sp.]
MATFVLVHGGGHGGWCWQPVARRLRKTGHEVHAPTLTGLGERRHLLTTATGLDTHIEDVAQVLFHEDLRDVVLVGHSYGGMVITGAADRMPDRIARLVFLDAAIPLDGEALLDSSPGLKHFDDSREVDGVRLGLWPENAIGPLYGLTDPELAAWALPRLAPHPWKTFADPLRLTNPEALAAIPRAIVNCPQSLARRPPETRARWLDAPYVREIDTGHDLMLTEPDQVARMLDEIAGLS